MQDRPDNASSVTMPAESPEHDAHGDDDDHPENDHGGSDPEPQ